MTTSGALSSTNWFPERLFDRQKVNKHERENDEEQTVQAGKECHRVAIGKGQ